MLLIYLLAVVAVAATGGVWPALGASIAAFVLANWYFISPLHEWTIHEGKDLIALVVFPFIGLAVRQIGRRLYRINRRAQEKIAELNVLLHEAFAGTKIVKAFGRERHEGDLRHSVGDSGIGIGLAGGRVRWPQPASDHPEEGRDDRLHIMGRHRVAAGFLDHSSRLGSGSERQDRAVRRQVLE